MPIRRILGVLLCVVLPGWAAAWRPREMPRVPGEIVVQYRSAELAQSATDTKLSTQPSGLRTSFSGRTASLHALDQKYRLIRSRPVLDPNTQERLRTEMNSARLSTQDSALSTHRSSLIALGRLSTLAVLTFDSEAPIEEICAAYRADPNVVAAEPNWIGTLFAAPSDPLYPQQSLDFSRIGMETAWGIQTGSPSVIVAVIDSGVDANHADLRNVLAARGYNFVDGNTTIFDDLGHGTRVAGTIGAQGNNGEGIAGVAYGVRILPLDVADSSGVITSARAIAAVNYAVAHGADVINMSFGFYAKSSLFEQACDNTYAAGVVLVASAGNENQCLSLVYPAAFDSVIGVAATNSDAGDDRAVFSNYNSSGLNLVDLAAPGVTIFSTLPGSIYDGTMGSGTSFASPMVAGVAALLKSRYPTQSAAAIRHHLLATATPVGAWAGSGRLDAAEALTSTPAPAVTIEQVIVDDSKTYRAANDADGKLDAGEIAALKIQLSNTGADATNLTGTIAEADPEISTPDTAGAWGTLQSAASATNDANPFTSLTYTSASPTVKRVAFTLNLSANGGAYLETLNFQLETENAQTVNAASYFTPQTWTADKTWEVLGTQNFNAGLTIQPGTVVKLAQSVDLNINAGALTANGTATSPILFTSLYNPQSAIANPQSAGPRTEPVNLAAYQQVRYVSASTGSDTTGNGSAESPWKTITHALSQISDASSSTKYALLVAEGRYAGATIQMKEYVDLYGGFKQAGWTRDIFAHPSILHGEDARTVAAGANNGRLDGFIVLGGKGDPGGGIVCGTSTTVSNNVISRHSSVDGEWGAGGGVYCSGGSPMLSNNVIAGNMGVWHGGGIYCSGGSPKILNNVVSGNWALAPQIPACGGGIYCVNSCATILNNVITENTAQDDIMGGFGPGTAGGVYCDSSATIVNNVITRNIANGGGGGFGCGGLPSLRNNIIYRNTGTPQVLGTPVVTYSDIEGGYSGSGNIGADPRLADDRLWDVADQVFYDSTRVQTVLVDKSKESLENTNALVGRVIRIWPDDYGNRRYFVIAWNSGNAIGVWGDATRARGATIRPPQPYEVQGTDHLTPESPCIDAGTNTGAPATDIDGDTRPINGGLSLTVDMGADEYNPTKQYPNLWGQIYIKPGASNSSLRYCIAENGRGVLNESASSGFADCTFRNNAGWGLRSTAGTSPISSCTTTNNQGGGISDPSRNMTNCSASLNSDKGLVGASLTNCTAYANIGDGLSGLSAIGCTATFNGGVGLLIQTSVTNCTARDNRGDGIRGNATGCTSSNNDGVGIVGSADNCDVLGNGSNGVQGNAVNSRILNNKGTGVTGSTNLSNCEIRGNTGVAVSGAQTINRCRITDNGSGISGATTINGSYITANTGDGVNGGAVSSSTIVGNKGKGINAPTSVYDSWVMYNRGIGVDSPSGNVTYSSIRSNLGYGVRNLAAARLLNYCNLYDNILYEYYDNRNDSSGSYPANCKDFRFNYWGAATAAEMTANPFPSVSITRIYDLFDNPLPNGWYANYGGTGEFAVAPVANAPDNRAPAFLLSVAPDMSEPLPVGETTFTLVFSKAMNTTILPAVTFGTTTPFTQNVVAPNPGWLNATTWRGKFAIAIDTGDGTHTLRVSQATAADGFVIPDDTTHQFIVESGRLGANNGLAVALGANAMRCEWRWQMAPPPTLQGYDLLRSGSGLPGTYDTKVNATLLTTTGTVDTGLQPSTIYFYVVYWVDSSFNRTQMTPPFYGTTEAGPPPPNPPVMAAEPPFTSGTTNQVSWGAVPGAVAYLCQCDRTITYTLPLSSGWTTARQWRATGLSNGVTYYYRVMCRNAQLTTSPWSNVVISRQDATPPSAPGRPTDAGAYTSLTMVRFDWRAATDGVSGVASYDLQVGTTSGGSGVFNQNVGNVLTRTVPGSNGQTLYARARARDMAGNIGNWSGNSDGITVDTSAPRLTFLFVRNYRTLEVSFNEAVRNADVAANYACTGGVRILGVLRLSATQYRLYTSDQVPRTGYTLTVGSAVRDRAGNSINPSYRSRSFVGGPATGVRSWQVYR
jgi:subtilisin family serine protease